VICENIDRYTDQGVARMRQTPAPKEERPCMSAVPMIEPLIACGDLAIVALDAGRLAYASPGFLAMTGLASIPTPPDLEFASLVIEQDRARVGGALAAAAANDSELSLSCSLATADRSDAVVQLTGRVVESSGSRRLVLVVTDITHWSHEHSRLNFLAFHDSLTGLPNRGYLLDRAGRALSDAKRNARSCALLLVDLDNFKNVNDTRGHAAGDAVLKAIGDRLMRCARSTDLVGRLGGDEFVIVLPSLVQRDETALVASRVIRAASEPVKAAGGMCQVGASVGIAVYPQDGPDLDMLVSHADAAMYRAKALGKNRYAYAEASREDVLAMDALVWSEDRDLGDALIDRQHRELVERLNGLCRIAKSDSGPDVLRAALDEVVRFLMVHFETEERLMDRHPGPDATAHREEHRRLIADLACLITRVDRPGLAIAVRYVYDWLYRHIDNFDRCLAASLASCR
jgi:diguanylate cyclase (GGDEF)-like protein/hemerythrin-like metal-binding protein